MDDAEKQHGDEGPASRESRTEEGVLPSRYFEEDGCDVEASDPDGSVRFYQLQPEDATMSSASSSFVAGESDVTRPTTLALAAAAAGDDDVDLRTAGIVFSPGGSEAYVFTQGDQVDVASESLRPQLHLSSGRASGAAPREISDPIFLERGPKSVSQSRSTLAPRGERPKTVGQSIDSPQRMGMVRLARAPYRTHAPLEIDAQGDFSSPSTAASTAESSPRFPDLKRRSSHQVPFARDQFLQDPDSFNLNVSEQELNTDAESVASPRAAAFSSDRAMSPSVSSVISATSSVGARRNLEWDSGADLGRSWLIGDSQPQKEAAALLSTLEKLAIGNYSQFLRTEPEGTSSKEKSSRGLAVAKRAQFLGQSRQDTEEELRQARLRKFADSLLRPKELRKLPSSTVAAAASAAAGAHPRRSSSRESSSSSRRRHGGQSDSTPESSPSHRGRRLRSQRGRPHKSLSLSDLLLAPGLEGDPPALSMRSARSNSDLSLLPSQLRRLKYLAGSSGPSSCSSTTTVVRNQQDLLLESRTTQTLPMDIDLASSLPAELQDLSYFQASSQVKRSEGELSKSLRRSRASETSLTGRRSGSRSFETVINVDLKRGGNVQRWEAKDKLNAASDSFEDTEEEIEAVRRSAGDARFADRQQPEPAWSERAVGTSSAATTSEDERVEDRRGFRAAAVNTESSTMDSALLDRAKSFEYFPGESSLAMQENSSSYEYLPGHLVTDRPGTVVSNYQDHSRTLDLSGISSMTASGSTTSEALGESDRSVERAKKARRRIELGQLNSAGVLDAHLRTMAEELNAKSREMLQAHIRKTRHFYKRIQKYTAMISSPALNDDLRRKQLVLNKLMELANSESLRAQIEQHQALFGPGSLDVTEEDEAITRQLVTETDGKPLEKRRSSSAMTKPFSTPQKPSGEDVVKQDLEREQRIEQLRSLRKQIKRLERLERVRLDGGPSNAAAEVSISASDASDQMSLTSLSSVERQPTSSRDLDKEEAKAANAARSKPIKKLGKADGKAQKASGASNAAAVTSKSKTIVGSTRQEPISSKGLLKTGRPDSGQTQRRKDFGQTYPTPRDLPESLPSAEKSTTSRVTQTPNRLESARLRRLPPVAYYLPLSNNSPIVIGSRILRESSSEDPLGKENRSILANFVAGLDASAMRIQRPVKAPSDRDEAGGSAATAATRPPLLTLQDALAARKPHFVRSAEWRRARLQQNRDLRLEQEEARRRWLEELALMPAPVRRRAEADPPPHTTVTIKRIFSYREMVEETRRKYNQLPEVRFRAWEARRRSSFRTNRVMKDLYKKRLQENVLSGRVSLSHFHTVVKF